MLERTSQQIEDIDFAIVRARDVNGVVTLYRNPNGNRRRSVKTPACLVGIECVGLSARHTSLLGIDDAGPQLRSRRAAC